MPGLTEGEYEALKSDIKEHGILYPAIVDEDSRGLALRGVALPSCRVSEAAARQILRAPGVLGCRASLELERHECLVPDHPCVVSRFYDERISGAYLGFCSILVCHVQTSRINDANM